MDLITNLFLEFREAIPDEWMETRRLDEIQQAAQELRNSEDVKASLKDHTSIFAHVLNLLSFVSLKVRKAKVQIERLFGQYEISARNELKDGGEKRPTKDLIKAHITENRADYNYLVDGLEGLKALEDYMFGLRQLALSRENVLKERSTNDRVEYRDEYKSW